MASNSDDDEIDLDAIEDPMLREMMKHLDAMREDMRERFVRVAERVAALPREVQATLTQADLDYMLENDSDLPRH